MKWFVQFFMILVLLVPSAVLTNKNYRIAVLPFDKINKEKNLELETLSVGISETLSGALSNVNNFIVIDSYRVKKYLLENVEFSQTIGTDSEKGIERLRRVAQKKLEGDYLVYGSFYKIGNQIKLDAKFLNVESGKVLKAASVHGVYPDKIFELQEDLAKKLTGAINGNVNERQTESMNEFISSTNNYEAYQYYIQARVEHLKYNQNDYPKALRLYKKSLGLDPKFALAWAGMSEVNALWGYQIKFAGGDDKPMLKQAIQDGLKAVKMGQNLYQTHRALSLAYVENADFDKARAAIEHGYKLNDRDPEILYVKAQVSNVENKDMARPGTESNKYIMQCLNINPELIIARWGYAFSLAAIGKKDEALAEYEKVLTVNPLHTPSLYNMALIYYDKKDYRKTIQYAQKASAVVPDVPHYDYTVGNAYYQLGDWVNAETAYRLVLKKNPAYKDALFGLANTLYMQKKYGEARDAYVGVLKLKPDYPGAEEWRKISEDLMNKK